MPLCDGLEATSRLRKEVPGTKVLMFSGDSGSTTIVAALRVGALGFVCKTSPHSVLVEAISAVASGKRFIDPALADSALQVLLADEPIATPSTLTAREHDVLFRVAWGYGNREIAAELGVSIKSVEGYRARGCEKLSLADRPAIVKYGQMVGWMNNRAG
jgi:two-component system response regulator NreC